MSYTKKVCPRCGFPDIYIGISKIECGYEPNCKNYSKKQAAAVKKIEEKARLKNKKDKDESSNREKVKDKSDEQSLFDFDDDDTLPFGFPICYSPD